MKNVQSPGEQLLQHLLAAFNQGTESVLTLFNPDATVEYPYAAAMGMSARLTLDDYRKHLDRILVNMREIKFSSLRVFPLQQQDAYWAEVHGETIIPTNGALYQQDYVIFFELKNGKFTSHKEYWNVLPVLKVLLPPKDVLGMLDFQSNTN